MLFMHVELEDYYQYKCAGIKKIQTLAAEVTSFPSGMGPRLRELSVSLA